MLRVIEVKKKKFFSLSLKSKLKSNYAIVKPANANKIKTYHTNDLNGNFLCEFFLSNTFVKFRGGKD